MKEANAALLVLAREARGITQVELATKIGVAQGTISKVENGLLAPSEELVAKYSESLDYPIGFFYQEHAHRSLPITFYRKRASVTATAIKRIEANLNIMRGQVRALLKSATVPPMRVPQLNLADYRGYVDDLTAELRMRWHLPRGPVGNLTKLLEDLGVIVIRYDFGTAKTDGVSIYEPADKTPPIVFINPSSPGCRLRYTLAHELAHIILHHHQPFPDSTCEDDADAFAASFMMPAGDIRGQLSRVTLDTLANLKTYWRMSMQAILCRAESLGKITESQAARLWATISKLGYRTKEPVDVPRDEPTLINELMRYHMTQLGYGEGEMTKVLNWYPHEYRPTYLGSTPGLRLVK